MNRSNGTRRVHRHPGSARGKPPVIFRSLGLDLGGSTVKANVVERTALGARALVHDVFQFDSEVDEGPRVTVERMFEGGMRLLGDLGLTLDEIDAIGIASPGPSSPNGVLFKSPNLRHRDWPSFALRAAIARSYGKRTSYANDANAGALGEATTIRRKHYGLLMVSPGSGLGGGYVEDGRVFVGRTGAGLEVGHLALTEKAKFAGSVLDPPVCGCGIGTDPIHFESVVSLHGLAHQLEVILRASKTSADYSQFADHPLHSTAGTALQKARTLLGFAGQGDELALLLFDRQAIVLGHLLAELTRTVDPDVIRIGGGLAEGTPAFTERYLGSVRRAYSGEVYTHQAGLHAEGKITIDFATLGDRAGAIGAALYAAQRFFVPA